MFIYIRPKCLGMSKIAYNKEDFDFVENTYNGKMYISNNNDNKSFENFI